MVKVSLTRGEWDMVTFILSKYNDNALVLNIWNQMQDQIDKQEY